MNRRFMLVDVFGVAPFSGNPLAVVAEAQGLDTEAMQAMTRWFNLSETAFLLPPDDARADYRVRIFTLERELPFAGHPTLGSCHAWLEMGGIPKNHGKVIQECGAGLVSVASSGAGLAFAAPPLIRTGPVDAVTLDEVAALLQVAPASIVASQWVDNGPGWVAVQLTDAAAVLALQPRRDHSRRIDVGVVGLYPPGSPHAYEVRALFSDHHGTVVEDPVTGSLNASIAQWLLSEGLVTAPYIASQGRCVGRTGQVSISEEDGTLWIGGKTVTMVEGSQR